MKLHPNTFDPFKPSRLLIRPSHDAYEELGHAYISATEAQHATKLRSRQMAASAVRYLRERSGQSPTVLEPDVVKVLQMLSEAMVRGLDHPVPFTPEAQLDLRKIVGDRDENFLAWQLIVSGLIQAAEQEMAFEAFVVFEVFALRLMTLLRLMRAACALAPYLEPMSEEAAVRFLAYSPPAEAASWDSHDQDKTRELLKEFYTGLTEVLGTASEAEVRLFMVRFAAERLAVRFECNFREWQFLFATLEQCIQNRIGLEISRPLSGFFLNLQNVAPVLEFVGSVHRHMGDLKAALSGQHFPSGVEVRSLLEAAVAEMLLAFDRGGQTQPPIHIWAILNGQSVLSSLAPEDLRRAVKSVCEALLQFAERAWVDQLEEPLQQMVQAVEWVAARRKIGQWMDVMAEHTAKNLAEGLEVLRSNSRLSGDLVALINHACQAKIFFRHPDQQTAYLRRWFVVNVAMPQLESGWQHAKTIASSLRTVFATFETDLPLYQQCADAIEQLDKIDSWVGEAGKAVVVWPHITVHGLSADDYISDSTCQRDALWVLRKLVLNFLHFGLRRAPRLTLSWLAQEVVPFAVHPKVESFETTYRQMLEMVEANEVLKENAIPALVKQLLDGTTRTVVGVRLWLESGTIARRAAETIYQKLPEYAAAAEARKGAFGETSRQLCERDQSLILRRVAQGLDPEVDDPVEFVDQWWNNVVNAYIATRTPNLFAVQLKALHQGTSEVLGVEAANWVASILRPILPGAEKATDEEKLPERLRFRHLKSVSTVRSRWSGKLERDLASFVETQTRQFSDWLAQHRPQGIAYAEEQPITPVSPAMGEEVWRSCEKLLLHEWPLFWLHGGLDDVSCGYASEVIAANRVTAAHWERFLMGLMTSAAGASEVTDLARVVYLGHWVEWLRQVRVGIWLEDEADVLARDMSEHLHGVIPEQLAAVGHPADAGKCHRDYAYVLKAMGRMLQEKTRLSARLHLHRYLVQMVAPYTRYTEHVWAMVWRSAEFKRARSEDQGVEALLTTWFSDLESCGKVFEVIGPIAARLNAQDDPVFSMDAKEESAWRDAVNLLLALAAMAPAEDEALLKQAAIEAVQSLPMDVETFAGRVDAVMAAIRDWFLDLDLKPLRQASHALDEAIHRHRVLMDGVKSAPVLGAKFAQVVKSSDPTGAALILAGLRELVGGPGGPQPVGLAQATLWAVTVHEELKGDADRVTADWPRMRTALANLWSDVSGVTQVLEQGLDRLGNHVLQLNALKTLWQKSREFHLAADRGESCARDQHWLARRVIVEAHAPNPSSAAVLRWFGEQILRYAGHLDTATVQELVHQLREKLQAEAHGCPALLPILNDLVEGVPALMVGRKMITQAAELADKVVQRSGVDDQAQVDPAKCRRDVGLLLTASGWGLLMGYSEPKQWFQTAVAPHLREHAHQMASRVYGSLIDLTRDEWHAAEHAVIERSFRELAQR